MSRYDEQAHTHFVTIEDAGRSLRVQYQDVGAGERVVVMLHGSGPGVTAWANWRGVIPTLSERALHRAGHARLRLHQLRQRIKTHPSGVG